MIRQRLRRRAVIVLMFLLGRHRGHLSVKHSQRCSDVYFKMIFKGTVHLKAKVQSSPWYKSQHSAKHLKELETKMSPYSSFQRVCRGPEITNWPETWLTPFFSVAAELNVSMHPVWSGCTSSTTSHLERHLETWITADELHRLQLFRRMLRCFVWVNGSFKTAPWFSCCRLKLFNTRLWIKSEGVKVDVVVGLYVQPTWTQEVKVQLLTDLRLIMSVTQISLYTRNDQLDSSLLCVCGLKSSISWQSLIAVSSSVCVCVCVIWHHRHEVIAMRPSVPPERSSKGFRVT